jgi:hypothetical protein
MDKETYDYVINVGNYDLYPYGLSFSTKDAAIEEAKKLLEQYSYSEVVYMPEDDVDVNEVIWRSWENRG